MACLHVQLPLTWLALLEPGDGAARLLDLRTASALPAGQPLAGAAFGPELDTWRRACGIPRPSSAARASVLGATVCRALQGAAGWTPARLGIASASTTSATWCGVDFDSRGLAEGWNAVNPLLLPSTLPSALPTQIAMALGAQGCALAFQTGLLGVFHALEAAALCLQRNDADTMLVVAADENTPVQQQAHRALDLPIPAEFAGALALERAGGSAATLSFISYSGASEPVLPHGWADAPRFRADAPAFPPSMQNGAAMRAIGAALQARYPRALVVGQVPRLGSAAIGLEWAAC